MKELENGLHENIPNINYLNAGETSKLLQRIVIILAVPSSGGDYPSDKPKANGMVRISLSFKNFNQEVGICNLNVWFGIILAFVEVIFKMKVGCVSIVISPYLLI